MDNLRVFVIVFVVVQHVASIYSGLGLALLPALPPMQLDIPSVAVFGFFLTFCQSYDMALLFFLAGYFIENSYNRKGFGPFVKARCLQLMIPAVVTMAVITPFQQYVELGQRWFAPEKGVFEFIKQFVTGSNVMWFVMVLFIFSLVYALVRKIGGKIPQKYDLKLSVPAIVVLILILAGSAFVIRLAYPIGTYIWGLSVCFFPAYIAFFIIGVVASRGNFLDKITYKLGRTCLICGIVLGLIAWVVIMLVGGELSGERNFFGGMNLSSALFTVWEATLAIVMSIGLLGVFKEKLNHQGKFGTWMSDNSFGVYMFHLQILIGLALLARPLDIQPLVKWVLTTAVGLPLSYAAAQFIFRKIPLLKKIL
jgi:hypothetical protein